MPGDLETESMKLTPLVRPALWALVLLVITAAAGAAETAHLVLDINSSDDPYDGGPLYPEALAPAGERLVFSGEDEHAGELWTSDGTVAGTELLASPSCVDNDCSTFSDFVGSTRKLTFWGGEELWRSDGTPAGTFPLGPINYPRVDPPASQVAILGELLFFVRRNGASWSVWQTDGTVAGTREALNLSAQWLTAVGNRVFAVVDDELWRIDPGKGTQFLGNVGHVERAVAAGDRLVLFVSDGNGEQVWGSDGTPAGTRQLTHFPNRFPFDFPIELTSIGRHVYFVADDGEHDYELWVSDGTLSGTRRITDFELLHPFSINYPLETLQEVGNRVVFAASSDPDDDTWQLWSTDGRPESTTQLITPCEQECSSNHYPAFRTAKVGTRVFFHAHDEARGTELWSTDGTPAGTRVFRDFCPGACNSEPHIMPSPVAGGTYFIIPDYSKGDQLWWTDGTAAGTRKIIHGPQYWVPRIVPAGNKLFLTSGAPEQGGGRLWVLDGKELRPLTFPSWTHYGSNPFGFSAQGDRLFFSVREQFDDRLWQTRGTAETTRLQPGLENLRDSALLSAGGVVYHLRENTLSKVAEDGLQPIATVNDGTGPGAAAAALGNLLYFSVVRDGAWEIWRTDGTTAGTSRLAGLPAEAGRVGVLTASAARLYFMTYPENGNGHLWTSDGTAAGTRQLIVLPGFQSFPAFDVPKAERFTRVGNLDYFVTFNELLEGDSYLLWRTDGTPAGTRQVELSTNLTVLYPEEMIGHEGALYLLGKDSDNYTYTSVLWRVDGDTVVQVRSFGQGAGVGSSLAEAGGLVLFALEDEEHGSELWASDGTAAGTRILREISPGSVSAHVSELTPAGARVFFTAWDEDHGIELWQTDGTEAGTRLVHDLAPGPASSSPRELTVMGDQLYFSADDGLTGRELWALPLSGSGGCQPSTRVLCLQGGRYRVEVSWRDFQKHSGKGTAVSVTPDTGYFWFFDPANAELIVKVLDGQTLNGHVWVFYGALSNVEYVLTVTDMQTGFARRYMNPPGNLASVGDTQSFGPLGAHSATPEPLVALPSPPALVSGRTVPAAATGSCQPGPQRLCLNGGRFAVEASWKDFQGKTGTGTAVSLSADTGYFWFFDQTNVEVLLKVLDGTPLNGKFWVFYGALSNVEYTLTVTDTQTGAVKEYRNPSGRFASVADTGAFSEVP
jgi:ELWxxDGT repeat protein